MKSVKFGLVSMLMSAAISTSAFAANLMAGSFAPIQEFTAEGSLRIFPSGSFFQSIFVATPQTVMISFSAQCVTISSGLASTRVTLLIDGVATAVNAFCSTNGPGTPAEVHSFVIAKNLTAGSHSVQMRVTPIGPAGTTSRIRNLSLLSWD